MPFTVLPAIESDTIGYLLERGWALRARCARCSRQKVWQRQELVAFPAGLTIAGFRDRLGDCSACGSDHGTVDLLNDNSHRAKGPG